MQHSSANQDLALFFTPRWTWRAVVLAGTVSASVYLMLPYLETLSAPPERTTSLRSIKTANLPPPPPPPPQIMKNVARANIKTPKPRLQQLRRKLVPMQAVMDLSMAMGDIRGDFDINFGITRDALGDQVEKLIFDISELDQPPRALARLKPIYPRLARMRNIEGTVQVEFVVLADGSVTDIQVVSARPGDMFVATTIRAIERWRFSPGTINNEAVASRVRLDVEFKLD